MYIEWLELGLIPIIYLSVAVMTNPTIYLFTVGARNSPQ